MCLSVLSFFWIAGFCRIFVLVSYKNPSSCLSFPFTALQPGQPSQLQNYQETPFLFHPSQWHRSDFFTGRATVLKYLLCWDVALLLNVIAIGYLAQSSLLFRRADDFFLSRTLGLLNNADYSAAKAGKGSNADFRFTSVQFFQ